MSYAVIMRRYFYRDRHCRWMPIRSTNPPFDIIEFEPFSSAKEFIDEEGAISKRRFDPGKQLLNVLSHGEYAIPSYKIIKFDAAQKIVSMEPLIDGSDIDWSGCACETNSSSHCGNCDACDTHFSEGVSDIINKKYIEAIEAIEAEQHPSK